MWRVRWCLYLYLYALLCVHIYGDRDGRADLSVSVSPHFISSLHLHLLVVAVAVAEPGLVDRRIVYRASPPPSRYSMSKRAEGVGCNKYLYTSVR